MLDIFHGLRLVVKKRSINIDNAVFRCHWFFTSTLLVSFSVIITARQYVGQPIECHSVNKITESLLNSFCWVQGTFTIPQACNLKSGSEVPFPCIDNTRGRDIKIYAYYQWVGMVLFIQGLMFHFPYYLWKVWENGLISAITSGLRIALLSDQERIKKRTIVVEYIYGHLGCHKPYAYKYFLCEFICLINLFVQIWCVNKFFDGQFLRYGLDVIQFNSQLHDKQQVVPQKVPRNIDQLSRYSRDTLDMIALNQSQSSTNKLDDREQSKPLDPMTFIFPRMTKCTYYDFGSSGDVQKHDAICLLPLNIINEKIYIALWFWFLILAILTLLVIIYRLFAFFSIGVRSKGLISRCKLSNERDISLICANCDVGDWFLFYMIAENLDPIMMREIISLVADKIYEHYELKKGSNYVKDQVEEENPGEESVLGNLDGKIVDGWSRRDSGSYRPAHRRGSITGDLGAYRTRRARSYSRRIWSLDLNEMRQRLTRQGSDSMLRFTNQDDRRETFGQVSAPPANQMELEARPLRLTNGTSSCNPVQRLLQAQRRGSLTRSLSGDSSATTKSASDSFIMEMNSSDSHESNGICRPKRLMNERETRIKDETDNEDNHYHTHTHTHTHRQSVGSIRDLNLDSQRVNQTRDFDIKFIE